MCNFCRDSPRWTRLLASAFANGVKNCEPRIILVESSDISHVLFADFSSSHVIFVSCGVDLQLKRKQTNRKNWRVGIHGNCIFIRRLSIWRRTEKSMQRESWKGKKKYVRKRKNIFTLINKCAVYFPTGSRQFDSACVSTNEVRLNGGIKWLGENFRDFMQTERNSRETINSKRSIVVRECKALISLKNLPGSNIQTVHLFIFAIHRE